MSKHGHFWTFFLYTSLANIVIADYNPANRYIVKFHLSEMIGSGNTANVN